MFSCCSSWWKTERRKKANAWAGEKHTAFAKPLSNTDYSDYVLLRLAYLEDFDLLAKKDLRLGQVLLVDALDGHLPVCLLHSRRTRTRGWKQISKTFTTSVCWLANLKCHFWEKKKNTRRTFVLANKGRHISTAIFTHCDLQDNAELH